MKRSAIFILSLSFLLCAQFASGQGYRGKRFTIAYQPGYSMLIPTYDFQNIMMHHKLNAGVALGKHLSLNLTGSYTNSRALSSNDYYESVQVNDVSAGITLQYFYTNFQSFAPIGRYVGLGIDFGMQNSKRDLSTETQTIYRYDSQVREKMMMISIYLGKNFLVRERILLGYGVQLGVITQGDFKFRHCVKPQFIIGIPF